MGELESAGLGGRGVQLPVHLLEEEVQLPSPGAFSGEGFHEHLLGPLETLQLLGDIGLHRKEGRLLVEPLDAQVGLRGQLLEPDAEPLGQFLRRLRGQRFHPHELLLEALHYRPQGLLDLFALAAPALLETLDGTGKGFHQPLFQLFQVVGLLLEREDFPELGQHRQVGLLLGPQRLPGFGKGSCRLGKQILVDDESPILCRRSAEKDVNVEIPSGKPFPDKSSRLVFEGVQLAGESQFYF